MEIQHPPSCTIAHRNLTAVRHEACSRADRENALLLGATLIEAQPAAQANLHAKERHNRQERYQVDTLCRFLAP